MAQDWEGGSREGIHISLQLIHADVLQKPTQHSKAIISQLKILKRLVVVLLADLKFLQMLETKSLWNPSPS